MIAIRVPNYYDHQIIGHFAAKAKFGANPVTVTATVIPAKAGIHTHGTISHGVD
jgi:hypothetical protein